MTDFSRQYLLLEEAENNLFSPEKISFALTSTSLINELYTKARIGRNWIYRVSLEIDSRRKASSYRYD